MAAKKIGSPSFVLKKGGRLSVSKLFSLPGKPSVVFQKARIAMSRQFAWSIDGRDVWVTSPDMVDDCVARRAVPL